MNFARFALVALSLVLAGAASAQEPPAPEPPLQETVAEPWPHPSPRNANYTLEATLDAAAKTITGRGTLSWRNVQATPTSELWFHLYWNAWRNDHSTWMRQNEVSPRRGRKPKPRREDWGYTEVDAWRFDGADVTAAARYAAPDDGNPEDRTVVVLTLPRPVAPGETVEVEFEWRSKVPRTFARTGFRGDYFFIAHWFPKLGVYEPEGWNCHQFHANTEFFSDYGVYDVTLTVPAGYVLGATGRRVEQRDNPEGTVSFRHVQEDVHGFTWTTSPDYQVREARFEAPGLPPVDMRLLIQPEHLGQAERHFAATRAALEHYGTWYGAYPYGHITVVDPAYGSGAGGMEYPTLFTCGTRLFNPLGGGSPEGVTIHEAGHQFWYGIVGNNEFEHAWIDEGLNTFSDARTYDVAYGDEVWVKRYLNPPGIRDDGFLPVMFDGLHETRMIQGNRLDRFLQGGAETSDAQAVPTYRYYPPTGARISYDKTAIWLSTLENHLGWETLQQILATFFERYKFRHPRPADFFAVADEVSGQDLSWFFDQVHFDTVTFDYAVAKVWSEPAAVSGFVEQGGELVYADPEGPAERFRSSVAVRRHGAGVFPVDVLLVYEDGSESRVRWDGAERFKLIVEEGPAKLDYAVVDPERVLLLDLRYTNNSRVREPAAELAVAKWGSRWLGWLQDLLLTFTFFV